MFLSQRERIRHRRGGEGRAAEPGWAFVGSVFVAAHAPGTGSGRPAGCLVPCLHRGQRGDSAVTQPWTPHKRDTVPRSSLTACLVCAPKYLCLSAEAAAPGFLWKNAACPAPPALRYLLGTGRAQLGLR